MRDAPWSWQVREVPAGGAYKASWNAILSWTSRDSRNRRRRLQEIIEVRKIGKHFAIAVAALFRQPGQNLVLLEILDVEEQRCEFRGAVAGLEIGAEVIQESMELLRRDWHTRKQVGAFGVLPAFESRLSLLLVHCPQLKSRARHDFARSGAAPIPKRPARREGSNRPPSTVQVTHRSTSFRPVLASFGARLLGRSITRRVQAVTLDDEGSDFVPALHTSRVYPDAVSLPRVRLESRIGMDEPAGMPRLLLAAAGEDPIADTEADLAEVFCLHRRWERQADFTHHLQRCLDVRHDIALITRDLRLYRLRFIRRTPSLRDAGARRGRDPRTAVMGPASAAVCA